MKESKCLCGHRSKGYKLSDFDPVELKKGIMIEYEHTCNMEIARKIAEDHLSESSMYYQELEKMEKRLEEMKNSKILSDKRKTKIKGCKE